MPRHAARASARCALVLLTLSSAFGTVSGFAQVPADPGASGGSRTESRSVVRRDPFQVPIAAETDDDAPRMRTPGRITVEFFQADIRDVLATFAELTGRSIIPGVGVDGEITATIRDQPWETALGAILGAYGLASRELPSGIIQVDAAERLQQLQAGGPLMTRAFRIDYVPAREVADAIEALSSERGRISVNATTNMVIVTDTEATLAGMAELLEQLDVRAPQVAIQAEIIFVNRSDVEELGVTYQLEERSGEGGTTTALAESRDGLINDLPDEMPGGLTPHPSPLTGVGLGGASIAALGNARIRVQQPQLEAILSLVLGSHSLTTFLDALRILELSDVQAAPSITTLDNQPAEIWVGERTPLRVVDAGSTGVGSGDVSLPRATAELVETGIRLRVTPTITADSRILMQLHAERSSAQLAATDIGVVFQQQQGTTRLLVRDGETAVIGGLTVTERTTVRAGIPVLMDIPIVGAIFRTTRSREQKRDLLILVTPRIVADQA